MYQIAVLLLAALASTAYGQGTTQTSVAPQLRECYIEPNLVDRNNLPPTTISILIDIIRQIEDNPNINIDMRQLSASLLHAYVSSLITF